jgi:hypothetical protein
VLHKLSAKLGQITIRAFAFNRSTPTEEERHWQTTIAEFFDGMVVLFNFNKYKNYKKTI